MEKHAIRLYELLETKSFGELNAEDLAFVLGHLSGEEYTSQREIIAASGSLEYDIPVPLPLIVPQEKVVFWKRSIPLYKAILAAACIILMFSLFRSKPEKTESTQYAENPIDTLTGPLQAAVIHDTVVRFVEVVKFHEKLVRDTITVVQLILADQRGNRMLEVNSAVNYPDISKAAGEINSSSLSEDRSAGLVPRIVNSGVFEIGK